MFRRTTTILHSAALIAAALTSMTIAVQADDERILSATQCGPAINSIVRTENSPSASNSVGFVFVPGATSGFAVPAGQSRCVKVMFTAKTACRGRAVTDFCYIRATIDGVEMLPQGGGFQTFVSEDPTESAHAYLWVRRVGAGNHTVRIERRVGNVATSFLLDDWTFDVSIYQ